MELTINDLRNIKLQTGDSVYDRFRPIEEPKCPDCGGNLFGDLWPPNYGGGAGTHDNYESWGSMKVVCLSCKNCIRYGVKTKFWGGKENKETSWSERIPLVEFEGKWLTPHDVSDEEYKKKHGKYPELSFA